MKIHKRALTWVLRRVVVFLGQDRMERLPSSHPRVFALMRNLASYLNEQPTLYEVSGKQFERAYDLRQLAVRHLNALAKEGATPDRIRKMEILYALADEEFNAVMEADALNMTMELSDMEEREP